MHIYRIVANSAKQTVRKQQRRDRLRAKLGPGKPPIEHEVQINGHWHGANIARVNLKKR